MKNWKRIFLATGMLWSMWIFPVLAAAVQAESALTYYKVGVFLDAGQAKEVEAKEQGLHMHGSFANTYNIFGFTKAAYNEPYDLYLFKVVGFLEVSQTELL